MIFLLEAFSPVAKGGVVSWILLFLSLVLWYSIAFRYWILRHHDSTGNVEVSPLDSGRQMIRSIVIVAPLLGLLGTVMGMIETFSSLQTQTLHAQGGGIAGGIGQALVTTQMGLMVAIPGLLIGRQLDRKQEILEDQSLILSTVGGN